MSDIYQALALTNISKALPSECKLAGYEALSDMISSSLLDKIDAHLFNIELSVATIVENASYSDIKTVFLCNKNGGVISSKVVSAPITNQYDLEDVIGALMSDVHGGYFCVDIIITETESGRKSEDEVYVQSGHGLAAANDACEWVAENFFGENALTCSEIDGIVNELAESGKTIIFTTDTESCEIVKIRQIS